MEERNHAILSSSASHRWLHCTAAPSIEETLPDTPSEYAAEGTLAHAIGEAKLREYLHPLAPAADCYASEHNGEPWTAHRLYLPEMEECTDAYRDIVAGKMERARLATPDAVLLIEQRLDFGDWVPEGFGTADAVIIADGTLEVLDYKHGKGVEVSAFRNPQMMIYALGAWKRYSFDYRIETVRMTIVQPRISNVSEWQLPIADLQAWGDGVLRPKAREAFRATLGCAAKAEPGEWCRFCKARKSCRARAEAAAALPERGDPRLLTAAEVARLLPKAAAVKGWCDDIEEHALALMLSGTEVRGYKVVEGRSVRKVSDAPGLASALTASGYGERDIYKPRELATLSVLERLCGKREFAALAAPYITKPQGKPTVARAADRRPAFSQTRNDLEQLSKQLSNED